MNHNSGCIGNRIRQSFTLHYVNGMACISDYLNGHDTRDNGDLDPDPSTILNEIDKSIRIEE